MVKILFDKITNNIEVRQNLSQIRQLIKVDSKRNELLEIMKADQKNVDHIIQLLQNEDAKTRKNAALLMGDLGNKEFLESLFHAYQNENQLFVRSAYLEALKSFQYFPYISDLKNRLHELSEIPLDLDNKKHIEEEMHKITELIVDMEGISTHEFTGFHNEHECILLTNKLHTDITEKQLEQLKNCTIKPFHTGVLIISKQLEPILSIRTYSEILFLLNNRKTCENDPQKAAFAIVQAGLVDYLKKNHSGIPPFYFRVELKSKMPLDKKAEFAKKFSREIERLSNRELLNSPSNYEIEIRLIENKSGLFHIMLKLNTIKDTRFDYRLETLSSSIKPVNAALIVALAKDYMVDNARVLDPFCGVGTMLIERQKLVKANTSYGIDLSEEAILKARTNTEAAGQIIHFINRDFFDFTHEYQFDEIFTNMPFATGRITQDKIQEIYEKFFDSVKTFLTQDGTIIMYSHDKDIVKTLTTKNRLNIIKEILVMDKEQTYLYIIK